MYKFIGLAMMGLFVMMIIPGNLDATQSNDNKIYGMATLVKNDSQGNEVFQQSVHNQITTQGELYLMQAVFADTVTAAADVDSIGAICVTQEDPGIGSTANDLETAVDFDTGNTLDDQDVCEEDPTVTLTNTVLASTAVIGPLSFASGEDNVDDNDTIAGIGICQVDSDLAALSFGDGGFGCAEGGNGALQAGGILFALIEVTPTTLASGETVDITYTFDITSITT